MFLITGGGSGIGRALAQSLAAKDREVLIVGRREHLLEETASFSSLITYLHADVSNAKGREKIVNYLNNTKTLEGLIHNAGVIKPIESLTKINESSWQQIMATNLHAPLFLTQSLLEKLQKGRILHIGSASAYFPVAGWAGYCVSKAGLAMLTRCWQLENPDLAVTSVMPGIIDTDMQGLIRDANGMEEEKLNFFKTLHQEKKLLSTATVAAFLSWLLLDTDCEQFRAKEWDIYEKDHHPFWLKSPHQVPNWE
ncbi:MAG: SDR family NAD(P)-dependent oxidoreductase [Tatlockia sp.]|nr:SDR family NAD(P)-dependent oxidoreductase [Tatlockia sp.]